MGETLESYLQGLGLLWTKDDVKGMASSSPGDKVRFPLAALIQPKTMEILQGMWPHSRSEDDGTYEGLVKSARDYFGVGADKIKVRDHAGSRSRQWERRGAVDEMSSTPGDVAKNMFQLLQKLRPDDGERS